jgi:hypothetical protein
MSRTLPTKTRCSHGALSPRRRGRVDRATRLQRLWLTWVAALFFAASNSPAQTAVNVPRPEEKDRAKKAVAKQQEKKAQRTSEIELHGQTAFDEKTLRSQLKEQIATIDEFGLTAARGDDAAFFLELFYRKHGYAKANVRYTIESGNRLRLDITEGPLVTLGLVNFVGNQNQPTEVIFDYAVGPTSKRAWSWFIAFTSRAVFSTRKSIRQSIITPTTARMWTPPSRSRKGGNTFSAS